MNNHNCLIFVFAVSSEFIYAFGQNSDVLVGIKDTIYYYYLWYSYYNTLS